MLSKLAYLAVWRSIQLLVRLARADAAKDLEILILRHQLSVLRRLTPCPRLEPADRALLAAVSRVLPRSRWSCFLVQPETLLGWHRRLVAGAWTYPHRQTGRPPLDPVVQQLIVRLAAENPRWGYQRSKGELQRLGVQGLSDRDPHDTPPARARPRATTGDHDLESVPARAGRRDRGVRLLHRRHHLAAAAVCAVLHRAGHSSDPCGRGDRQPRRRLVTQQARNLLLVLDERGRRVRFLLYDRDARFTRSFDDVFRSEGGEVLVPPVRAPKANAYAERWVRTVRAECLDWLLIVGRGHQEQVLGVYTQHYNCHRPHQALGLQSPEPSARPTVLARSDRGAVRRRDLLGGLLHEYRRAA